MFHSELKKLIAYIYGYTYVYICRYKSADDYNDKCIM